jgi:MFS family permease
VLAEATASLLKLVSGRLSDRLGRRKGLVLLGYGLSTLTRPLMALATASPHVVG